MELSLRDRLLLTLTLPTKGKFEDLIIREDVIKKVQITQKEVAKYEVKQNDKGGLTWTPNEDKFPTEFSELEKGFIKKSLKDQSEKGELTPEFIELYKQFVE